jgi:hypothetical protein
MKRLSDLNLNSEADWNIFNILLCNRVADSGME